jgi:hypothetical protein
MEDAPAKEHIPPSIATPPLVETLPVETLKTPAFKYKSNAAAPNAA